MPPDAETKKERVGWITLALAILLPILSFITQSAVTSAKLDMVFDQMKQNGIDQKAQNEKVNDTLTDMKVQLSAVQTRQQDSVKK